VPPGIGEGVVQRLTSRGAADLAAVDEPNQLLLAVARFQPQRGRHSSSNRQRGESSRWR